MKGIPGTEPTGIAGDCFWVLVMYESDGDLTTAELHERITSENAGLDCYCPTRGQVRRALHGLACSKPSPLVRKVGSTRGNVRWLLTDHGRAMLDVWVPDGDSEPVRRPSGLGWPGQNVA